MKKIVITFWLIVAFFAFSYAQQFNLNNFYLYNQVLFNSSASAVEPGLHTFIGLRDQWTGYKNAPEIALFGVQANARNTGWALTSIFDRAGLLHTMGITGHSAYKITLKRDNVLALGADFTIKQNTLNYDEISNADLNDPAINSNKFFETILQAGAGITFQNKHLRISLSAPDIYTTVTNTFFQNIFLFSSYQIGEENYYKHSYFKPFFLFHYSKPEFFILDLGAEVKFNDYFRAMAMIRSNLSATASVMVKIYNFYFGYAYEANFGYRQYLGLSSHEITIRFSDPYFFKSY